MRIAHVLGLGLLVAALAPAGVSAQTPAKAAPSGADTVTYTPSRGTVVFTHGKHAKANECASCHHASKAEKPATAEHQKCSSCHTEPATEPMKTGLKAAFHNTVDRTGTCFDCHKKQAEAGKEVPTACGDCHKKAD